jgi:UDP-N-acetylmuramyl pentapeptide synthase
VLASAVAAGLPQARARKAETPEEGAAIVLEVAAPGDVVLVKGSRGARMERAVARLCGV